MFPICTNSPVTKFFLLVGMICAQLYCYILLEKLREGACIYASILWSENILSKSVTLSTLFLFALRNGLRVHKLDCFQIKLNQKTCFWTVPNALQPLMALVTSSIPLCPPPPRIVWTLDPQCQLFHSTDLLPLPVWVSIQTLQPDSC